jgi:hypothetical protein
MGTINEAFPKKSGHSIRVNDRVTEICNKTGLPFSNIVETCLAHFASMDDDDRVQFLVDYDPDKLNADQLKEPGFDYAERAIGLAKKNLGTKSFERTSIKVLLALGLALLVGVLLFNKKGSS